MTNEIPAWRDEGRLRSGANEQCCPALKHRILPRRGINSNSRANAEHPAQTTPTRSLPSGASTLARNLEHVDGLYVGATERGGASRLSGNLAPIAQNVDVGKGHMRRHGAELSSLGIKVKAVAHAVATMAGQGPQPVYQLDVDARPCAHRLMLPK